MLTLPEEYPRIHRCEHPWDADRKRRPWSLWEMLSHYAGFFSAMQVSFTQMIDRLALEMSWTNTPISQPLPNGTAGWSVFAEDPDFFAVLRTICAQVDLDSA